MNDDKTVIRCDNSLIPEVPRRMTGNSHSPFCFLTVHGSSFSPQGTKEHEVFWQGGHGVIVLTQKIFLGNSAICVLNSVTVSLVFCSSIFVFVTRIFVSVATSAIIVTKSRAYRSVDRSFIPDCHGLTFVTELQGWQIRVQGKHIMLSVCLIDLWLRAREYLLLH